jgi:uncharacterized SAM-binding protein YcdF (DUF218 family)
MRVFRSIFLILVSLGLVAVLIFASLCWQVDRHGRSDFAQPADAIVVLGAAVLPDGNPGPDLISRTQHAVALYLAGFAPSVICAGGVRGEPASAAAVCKALAISLGVPEQEIFLADGSANTEEDAQRVAALMNQHHWHTAVIVSHPLHMYRARLFFERTGLTVYTSPTSTDVDAIDPPWRTYYTVREAAGILWPHLEQLGFPSDWTRALQKWVYAGP